MPPPHAAYAADMMRDTQRESDDCELERRPSLAPAEEGDHMSDREASTRRRSRVGLILIGILLGSVLVRPAVAQVTDWARAWTVHIRPRVVTLGDSRWVKKATVRTGYFSCAGTAWESASKERRLRNEWLVEVRNRGTWNALFRCSAELPQGATIQAAVSPSRMRTGRRRDLPARRTTWPRPSAPTACRWPSSRRRGRRAPCRSSDTRSTDPLVDNAQYSYFAQCERSGHHDRAPVSTGPTSNTRFRH